MIQVVQRGSRAWDVTRVDPSGIDGASEYTLVGRVVYDDGSKRFFAEATWWQDIGHTFHRLPRGWLTKAGALRYLLSRDERSS